MMEEKIEPIARNCDEIAVGKMVWIWETDKRRNDADGKYIGRGDFELVEITGETRASWFIGKPNWTQRKFNKQTLRETGVKFGSASQMYGASERETYYWKQTHIEKLVAYVRALDDLPNLKEIADLAGYDAD